MHRIWISIEGKLLACLDESATWDRYRCTWLCCIQLANRVWKKVPTPVDDDDDTIDFASSVYISPIRVTKMCMALEKLYNLTHNNFKAMTWMIIICRDFIWVRLLFVSWIGGFSYVLLTIEASMAVSFMAAVLSSINRLECIKTCIQHFYVISIRWLTLSTLFVEATYADVLMAH